MAIGGVGVVYEAKVQDLGPVFGSNDYVVSEDAPVYHAVLMSRSECLRNVTGYGQRLSPIKIALVDHLTEAPAFDVFHGDESLVVFLAGLVDFGNAGMPEGR